MEYHIANETDLDILAQWNHQLIRDEGHRNPMTISQLRARMRHWLSGDYTAVIFDKDSESVAYALYRESEDEIYLRQLFVKRENRNRGIGKEAVRILKEEIWTKSKRLTVDVLSHNKAAIAFWRSVGYKDYCLTLEIMPDT
ncbi:MAG: GNAT family N-acetyltransferase [Planctomycetota bacterium]|jgi:ribosomal protein S18 acetylase RimI-like enzyme